MKFKIGQTVYFKSDLFPYIGTQKVIIIDVPDNNYPYYGIEFLNIRINKIHKSMAAKENELFSEYP